MRDGGRSEREIAAAGKPGGAVHLAGLFLVELDNEALEGAASQVVPGSVGEHFGRIFAGARVVRLAGSPVVIAKRLAGRPGKSSFRSAFAQANPVVGVHAGDVGLNKCLLRTAGYCRQVSAKSEGGSLRIRPVLRAFGGEVVVAVVRPDEDEARDGSRQGSAAASQVNGRYFVKNLLVATGDVGGAMRRRGVGLAPRDVEGATRIAVSVRHGRAAHREICAGSEASREFRHDGLVAIQFENEAVGGGRSDVEPQAGGLVHHDRIFADACIVRLAGSPV